MTPSKVSQPINNVALPSQTGDGFVAKATFQVAGGDTLIGFSASGWAQAANSLLDFELWVDSQPTGGRLAMLANQPSMHLALGRTWVHCPGLSPGSHDLAILAGPTTVTDQNDRLCVTVWEMGDGCAVRFAEDTACPQGAGSNLITGRFGSMGNQLLISGSASGWVTSQGTITAWMPVDGGDAVATQVFTNTTSQHLATVPTDFVCLHAIARGQHEVQINADGRTTTDGNDSAHLAVVEWVDPASAPVACAMNPPIVGAQAGTQHGDGGSVANSMFSTGGGPILVRTSVSAFTTSSGGVPLQIGIQIDGTTRGFAEGFANVSETHMAMVTNDLVIEGVPGGVHSVNLIGEANTYTDYNDRVSVSILEFQPG